MRWAALVILGGLTGCQEVALTSGGTQVPTPATQAAQIFVGADGISNLYAAQSPQGFSLSAPTMSVATPDGWLDVGPFEQALPVAARDTRAVDDALEFEMRLRSANVVVPVRVRSANDVEVCRFSVRLGESSITSALELGDGPTLRPGGDITVSLGTPMVEKLGACSIDATQRDTQGVALNLRLQAYLQDAFLTSAGALFDLNPLEVLGVQTGALGLRHVSVYDHRRGSIGVAQNVSPEGFMLSAQGLRASLDVGLLAQRAQCAPPIELDAIEPSPTSDIDPDRVGSAQADFGLAASRSTLTQLAHVLTLSGFVCRGLEDARRPEDNAELFATDDVGLDQLDLTWMNPGPWIRVSTLPSALPILTLRPQTNDIVLSWEDFAMDLYGEINGTEVRLARLTTSANATLRPQTNTLNRVELTIDAVNVTQASVSSEWLRAEATRDATIPWARRAILLFLENQFSFPLPLLPAHPLTVRDIEVRNTDVVAYISVQPL